MTRLLRALTVLLLGSLVACSAPDPAPTGATAAGATATEAPSEATIRIGDVTIRASAVQTSMLNPAVADAYGIERDAKTVLLLVGVRRGDDARAVALPATVSASVTNMRGSRLPLAMHELRSGDAAAGTALIDYVGSIDVSLPDKLQFDLEVQPKGGKPQVLQFSREFYPR